MLEGNTIFMSSSVDRLEARSSCFSLLLLELCARSALVSVSCEAVFLVAGLEGDIFSPKSVEEGKAQVSGLVDGCETCVDNFAVLLLLTVQYKLLRPLFTLSERVSVV